MGRRKKEVVDTLSAETHTCCLCNKEFSGKVMYQYANDPVCSWKCLYKEIRKKYRKILQQPLEINVPKKRGRKRGSKLAKEQEEAKIRAEKKKLREAAQQK